MEIIFFMERRYGRKWNWHGLLQVSHGFDDHLISCILLSHLDISGQYPFPGTNLFAIKTVWNLRWQFLISSVWCCWCWQYRPVENFQSVRSTPQNTISVLCKVYPECNRFLFNWATFISTLGISVASDNHGDKVTNSPKLDVFTNTKFKMAGRQVRIWHLLNYISRMRDD